MTAPKTEAGNASSGSRCAESGGAVAIQRRRAHILHGSGIARTVDIGLRSKCRSQSEFPPGRADEEQPDSLREGIRHYEKATARSTRWFGSRTRTRAHQAVEHQSSREPAHAFQNRLQRHEPEDDHRDPPVRDVPDRRAGRRGRLTDRRWATQLSKRAQRRLEALDRASGCNHPTGDIDEMLADIARGRDLR